MEYKKNQIVTVNICDIGIIGEGIGKINGYPFFVKDTVPGDTAEIIITKPGRDYGFGRLSRLAAPSPDRIQPRCSISRACGGCQLQSMKYERQLHYKEEKVRNNLMRIGGFSGDILENAEEPIIAMKEPWHYRNKVQYPIGYDKEGKLCAGFYAQRTHTIIPESECAVNPEGTERILKKILRYMEENHISAYDSIKRSGTVRHILIRYAGTTCEWMVCLVINDNSGRALRAPDRLIGALKEIQGMASISISPNTENTNVIMGKTVKLLWGQGMIVDSILGIEYEISPLAFYQVNSVQTEKLYSAVIEYAQLTGKETVWDIYCGIGTISLLLAKEAAFVSGVEIVPQAVEDARRNAVRNHISNVEFIAGEAERVLPEKYHETGIKADVVVVDPPRKGCEESVLETIISMAPDKIVYVSCDSATLARDLKYVCSNGYRIEKYRTCDMFPMTVHVETVVLMSRVKE